MRQATLVFPHQLFKKSDAIEKDVIIYLVEEYLFFSHYKFHKQKIAFHRASMKSYKNYLSKLNKKVIYIEAINPFSDVRKLIPKLIADGIKNLNIIDPTDNWLEKHIKSVSKEIEITWFDNPLFINTKSDLEPFFKPDKKKFYQTSFYKQQRINRHILMQSGQPKGGKWSYDSENRKKYPNGKIPPNIMFPDTTDYHKEAIQYVNSHFQEHYGSLISYSMYPINHELAEEWFDQFLKFRFHEFGVYEDAIVTNNHILNHSLISPLINVGLLNANDVIQKVIDFAKEHKVPINSTEGFIRQILGWREFIRGVYEIKGTEQRTKNFWNFTRKLPKSFYDGSTGIEPIDNTIKNILKTGYTHHIERLMILGNFMVLCEIDPNDVYQWFMELFIDSYDWVMVPNVFGMSLYADGGLMSTKPYISSSNYIMKMSNYKKGQWQDIWDGLFWAFMDKHRHFFLKNPRLAMLIRNFDKMDKEKKRQHLENADDFLKKLDSQIFNS